MREGNGSSGRGGRLYTALGIVAVTLWGSTVAFSRSVSERIDPLAVVAIVNGAAGVLGSIATMGSGRQRRLLGDLSRAYWVLVGGCFTLYMLCLYVAIGLCIDRHQALGVAIINYLWPSLTLVLAVPILGKRAGAGLAIGAIAAVFGIVLANHAAGHLDSASFIAQWRSAPLPYLLALAGAITWALYSNLTRRLAGDSPANAVPTFLLTTAVLALVLRITLVRNGTYAPRWNWSEGTIGELAYLAIAPTWLAYWFWDLAMRRGNTLLVMSISYLTPLLSVLIYVAYLGERPDAALWIGCALVILGALLCRQSVRDRPS